MSDAEEGAAPVVLPYLPPSPHPALTLSHLTDPAHRDAWDHLLGIDDLKESVVNHAVVALELRHAGVPFAAVPAHGLLLFSGPPGVGKSTLARGMAYQVGIRAGHRYTKCYLAEVNTHMLASDMLGRSQRAIQELFEDHLQRLAEDALIVVVIDEIEDLAVSRAATSLAANPVDVHRTTDAVLTGLDRLASQSTNLLVVATTNFAQSVDTALVSRADRVFHFSIPTAEGVAEIVRDAYAALQRAYPSMEPLSERELDEVTAELVGRDGRAIRKFVLAALAASSETSLDPSRITGADLVAAARSLGVP